MSVIDITTQQIGASVPGIDGAISKTAQNYEASIELAKAANPEMDSHLPTRTESALLYATLRDQIDKGDWYWTSTYYDDDKDAAFVQTFDNGYQYDITLNYGSAAKETAGDMMRMVKTLAIRLKMGRVGDSLGDFL